MVKTRTATEAKATRITQGVSIRALDLFAGCGGLSLGFQGAGYEMVGGADIDPIASRTYARNFHRYLPERELQRMGRPRDITKISSSELLVDFGTKDATDTVVDVLLGGPPCQAFARVGRAKLREVAAHPKAFLEDPRANLYLRFLDYVKDLRPLAVLVENVPDALNYGGHNIAEETCEALTDLGYRCRYTLLNAVYYGVPQMRERMFLIGYADSLGLYPTFPKPTHWVSLPRGYEGSRQVALKTLKPLANGQQTLYGRRRYYTPNPKPSPRLEPAVTAEEALDDLPRIRLHLQGKLRRGPRFFDQLMPYPKRKKLTDYALQMRTWPMFENEAGLTDHVIRYLPRDYAIFARMKPGDEYPQAHQHATELFKEKLTNLLGQGIEMSPGSPAYQQLMAETVPPYDPTKFPNKWRKMEADSPARTLMAHLGKDGYSHVHYDDSQARTISVREAARLQSFPDGFVFEGSMNHAFRLIGNAVPPLLARAIAREMMQKLRVTTRASKVGS